MTHITSLRRLLLGASAALALTACGDKTSAEDFYAMAQRHFDEGRLSNSAIELSNALKIDPQMREARFLLARTSLELGDAVRAERDFREAIRNGMPRAEVLPYLGRAILLQGNASGVLTETSSVTENATNAQLAAILGTRAQAFALMNELDEAESSAQRALELSDNEVTAFIAMALVTLQKNQLDSAREWLDKATQTENAPPEAWALSGDLALTENRLEDAEEAFTKAIERRAYPSLDYAKRAYARYLQGRFDDAMLDIKQLDDVKLGNIPYVQYVRGITLLAQDRIEDAAEALESSFANNPSFIPNRIFLALVRLQLGELEQALRHTQFALAQAPNAPMLLGLLGQIHLSRSDFAAAQTTLEAMIDQMPDNAGLHQMLALTALFGNDIQSSIKHLGELRRLESASDSVSEQTRQLQLLIQLLANQAFEADSGLSDNSETMFLLALTAFRENRFEDALALAESLHSADPTQINPINLMAAIHLATGNGQQARVRLEQSLQLAPNDVNTRLNLARLEAGGGNHLRAIELLAPVFSSQPDNANLALALAQSEAARGNQREAMRVLRESLTHNPASLELRTTLAAHHLSANQAATTIELLSELNLSNLEGQARVFELLGQAQLATGDNTAARDNMGQWAQRAPDNPAAHYWHAESLSRTGDFTASATALQRAIDLAPQFIEAKVALVQLHVLTGNIEAAGKTVDALIAEAEGQQPVEAVAGWYKVLTGQFAEAEPHLRRALAIVANSEVTIQLIRSLWGQERRDEAIQTLKQWISENPNDINARLHLAGAYLTLERNDDALTEYRRVLDIVPNHIPSINNVAWLSRKSDPAGATETARRGLEIAPQDPHLLDTMGMILLERGDPARARYFIAQAVEQAPENAGIRLHLAQTLMALERWAEARNAAEAALALSPDAEQETELRKLLERIASRP